MAGASAMESDFPNVSVNSPNLIPSIPVRLIVCKWLSNPDYRLELESQQSFIPPVSLPGPLLNAKRFRRLISLIKLQQHQRRLVRFSLPSKAKAPRLNSSEEEFFLLCFSVFTFHYPALEGRKAETCSGKGYCKGFDSRVKAFPWKSCTFALSSGFFPDAHRALRRL